MSESLKTPNHHESDSPAERFRVNPADYPIFSRQFELSERWGDNSKNYWNIDKTLSHYVTNTANLIATLDGSSIEYDRREAPPKPNHVIYLDKSARPVSWLVNTFWDDFSSEERPSHSYLNIDRLPWFRRSGLNVDSDGYMQSPDGSRRAAAPSDFHVENLDPSDFARLRSLYIEGGIDDEDVDRIMSTPSTLDGKNVLIVDEVARSGSTAKIATDLIKAAFPAVGDVHSAYFWRSGNKSSGQGDGKYQMLSIPVWYDSSTTAGRGIDDIDEKYYENRHAYWQNNKTRAQNFGSLILSAPANLIEEPGQKSRELMREIKHMREDFDAGRILLRYPRNYDPDLFEEYVEAQGLHLAPDDDPSPDSLNNVTRAIDSRPA